MNTDGHRSAKLRLLGDYRGNPAELFDGFEPDQLPFNPDAFGITGYETVDLVKSALSAPPPGSSEKELLDTICSSVSPRVQVWNKSAGCIESRSGYYAFSASQSDSGRLAILYSFFEVSPMRYHAYLHAILQIDF